MSLGLIDRLITGQRLKNGSLGKICDFLSIDLIDDRDKLEKYFKCLAMRVRKELLEREACKARGISGY